MRLSLKLSTSLPTHEGGNGICFSPKSMPQGLEALPCSWAGVRVRILPTRPERLSQARRMKRKRISSANHLLIRSRPVPSMN